MDYYTKYARVDGIILFDAASALSASVDLPVVCVGRAAEFAVRILGNTRPAMEEAIDYLISSGVTDIGFIGEHLTVSKEKAFTEIMTDKLGAYNPDFIAIGDRFADGGYETAKKIIERGKLPRAFICGYDYLAIGAMRCFTEHGYRIPDDIAIIGMDDIPEAEFMNRPLSSINSNTKDACRAAADTLINMLMGKAYKKCTVIPAKLNLRKSSEI
jgi:DNA-binding LacI/PurR family transcriptional regulator